MLLLLIVGLLEGVMVDLQAPVVVRWEPVSAEAREIPARRRMIPEWPTGFL